MDAGMEYIHLVRYANLLNDATTRLDAMESKPDTLDMLRHFLHPVADRPLVVAVEPCAVLEEMQKLYGEVKVNITYTTVHKLDVWNATFSLNKKTAEMVKRSSGFYGSYAAKNLNFGLRQWVCDTLKQVNNNQLSLTAVEFEKRFLKKYRELKSCDLFEHVVENLKENGVISTVSNVMLDSDVITYDFPSHFRLACMTWIVEQHTKSPGKPVSMVINSMNRHLRKLRTALQGQAALETQMKLRVDDDQMKGGVASLAKNSS